MANSYREEKLKSCQDIFVRTLIDGRHEFSEQELEARAAGLGMEWLRPPFTAFYFGLELSGIKILEKESLVYELRHTIQRFLTGNGYHSFCQVNGGMDVIALLSLDGKKTASSGLEQMCIRMREKLYSQFEIPIFIGIGSVVECMTKITAAAADARQMMGYRHQYADSGVINIANIVRFHHVSGTGSNAAFDRVTSCFQNGDLGNMSVRLDELVEQIRYRPHVSKTSIRRAMVELVVQILNIASNSGVDVNEVLNGRDPYWWILRQTHTEVITEWIMQISSELSIQIQKQQEKGERETIRIAKEYVDHNLGDAELGLQTVSEAVGLSASYFSQIFKLETGVGLSAYILMRRIERAKELLCNTKLKNEEIARQLGFASSSYFSQVFKKSEGISAGEYRRKHSRQSDEGV